MADTFRINVDSVSELLLVAILARPLGEYEPYAVLRAYSLAPVDYYRRPYTVPRVSMNLT